MEFWQLCWNFLCWKSFNFFGRSPKKLLLKKIFYIFCPLKTCPWTRILPYWLQCSKTLRLRPKMFFYDGRLKITENFLRFVLCQTITPDTSSAVLIDWLELFTENPKNNTFFQKNFFSNKLPKNRERWFDNRTKIFRSSFGKICIFFLKKGFFIQKISHLTSIVFLTITLTLFWLKIQIKISARNPEKNWYKNVQTSFFSPKTSHLNVEGVFDNFCEKRYLNV